MAGGWQLFVKTRFINLIVIEKRKNSQKNNWYSSYAVVRGDSIAVFLILNNSFSVKDVTNSLKCICDMPGGWHFEESRG